eukprot:m.44894 g.44894  ORF g.44894 m.44894 type:complete len:347 (+) comp33551_c0_seq15:1545-2585(+)
MSRPSKSNPLNLVGSSVVAQRIVDNFDVSGCQSEKIRPEKSGSDVHAGCNFQYLQMRGLPVVKKSLAEAAGKDLPRPHILSISRPPSAFLANTVLKPDLDHLIFDHKYSLSIVQEVLGNQEKRWYGETKTDRKFYLTTALQGGNQFPLLDMVTSPLSHTAPAGSPSYSKYSTIDVDPSLFGTPQRNRSIRGRVVACNEPCMAIQTVLPYQNYAKVFQDNGVVSPPSGKFFLTSVDKYTTNRTWLVIRDVTDNAVYPLVALDWEFQFHMQVHLKDDDGADFEWHFEGTPACQALPLIATNPGNEHHSLPMFPEKILKQKNGKGDFLVANEAFQWKIVFPPTQKSKRQ